MRCPNCAGEVPAGSRFCGICGRNVTAAPAPPLAHAIGDAAAGGRWPAAGPGEVEARPAMSLFELPAARRPRAMKLALVLALDAILAAAGIVMILSYLDARKAPPPPGKPAARAKGVSAVEVGAPKPVAATEASSTEAQPVKKAQRPPAGSRPAATVQKQPAIAAPVVTPVAEAAPAAEDDVDGVSERLTAMVERHGAELERCYQRVAKGPGPADPLEGRIDVHVTVMPDGSARDVHAGENTTGSPQLADCVVSLFQGWTLPAGAAEPVELIWPLQFRPPEK